MQPKRPSRGVYISPVGVAENVPVSEKTASSRLLRALHRRCAQPGAGAVPQVCYGVKRRMPGSRPHMTGQRFARLAQKSKPAGRLAVPLIKSWGGQQCALTALRRLL
jgi:hypothetical protein